MKDRGAFIRVFAAFLTIALSVALIHTLRVNGTSVPDYRCVSDGETTLINIKVGETGSQIARNLYENGVVKSYESFFNEAVSDPRSAKIAPGVYRLTVRNCAQLALEQLLSKDNIEGLISIIEGAWNSEIVDQMVASGFDRTRLIAALKEAPKGFTSAEGLLFPAQYSFPRDTEESTAISSMITRGLSELNKAGIGASIGKYSPQQLLIIASLVQAEGDQKDYAKVARVIFNRLAISMPLQLDSTVHYVKRTRGSVFLSTQSTLLKSPYNTYQRYGLPPGPIGNPGFAAMRAVAEPEIGDWLYFITVAPGDTRFTKSIDEFNSWKVLYKNNLRKGLFRSSR